jgi:hypothetical protein
MIERINALKVELYDILEQQSFMQRRNEMLENLKQEKVKELNDLRTKEQEATGEAPV